VFSLGWVELNDRHFIEEVTIVCGIFRGFSVLDGVFPVSGLFLFFTSGCSSFSRDICALLHSDANSSTLLFNRTSLSQHDRQLNLGSSSVAFTQMSQFFLLFSSTVKFFRCRKKTKLSFEPFFHTTGIYSKQGTTFPCCLQTPAKAFTEVPNEISQSERRVYCGNLSF